MKMIPLRGKYGAGLFALVDDDYFLELSAFKWCVLRCGYPVRATWKNGVHRLMLIHRQILNVPLGAIIDHKNGNKLDNRRENLRVCTHQQNIYNCKRSKNNKTGFTGVCWDKSRNKFTAYISNNYAHIHLGRFDNAIDAAKAYNSKAIELFGEFANLNNLSVNL